MEIIFKTVSRDNEEFDGIVSGQFSDHQVALPNESLNLSNERSSVTFTVYNKSDIPKPTVIQILLQIVRPRNLFAVAVPLLAVLANVDGGSKSILVFFAVCFLLISANLVNDLNDFKNVNDSTGTRTPSLLLRNAWLSHSSVTRIAMVLGGASAILAMFALWEVPGWVVILSFGIAILGLAIISRRRDFQFTFGEEIITFTVVGPLLTIATFYSVGSEVNSDIILWSCGWGFWYVVVTQFRKLNNLMHLHDIKSTHWMNQFGFDITVKSLTPVYISAVAVLLFSSSLLFQSTKEFKLFYALLIFVALRFSAKIYKNILKIVSPMSSAISKANEDILYQHQLFSIVYIVYFFYLAVQ